MRDVVISGEPFGIEDVALVARGQARAELSDQAKKRIQGVRAALERKLGEGGAHYGINTGFGSFSKQRIGDAQLGELQLNLIRSHACGVGEPLGREVVRGMMLLLAGSLSRGRSGVRLSVVELVVGMLNAGLVPVVPETGSVGASGDLAPLAHVALAMIGEGEVFNTNGARVASGEAMRGAGLEPTDLTAKEGLALINGTHLMAAQAALAVDEMERVFEAGLVAAAMSIDACRVTDAFLDGRVYETRNQAGPAEVARRLRGLIEGSGIVPSHRTGDPRVQDPYSFRCAAPVLGAAWDAIEYVKGKTEAELGAVTDNPLLFEGEGGLDVVSAGNFHGMPIALPLDVLAVAAAHVAGIAERRVYHMLSGFEPETQLPAYLSPLPGLHSGLMIVQYTAAACCNELIGLANPASVANLSTSAGMEDYNSFGPRSAAKARRAIDLVRSVVAIELLCASQAVEYHRPLRSSGAVEGAIEQIRGNVPEITGDRPFARDIETLRGMIAAGDLAGTTRKD